MGLLWHHHPRQWRISHGEKGKVIDRGVNLQPIMEPPGEQVRHFVVPNQIEPSGGRPRARLSFLGFLPDVLYMTISPGSVTIAFVLLIVRRYYMTGCMTVAREFLARTGRRGNV